MSWSIPLQLNNLRYEVEALAQTSITNPLTAPLNCNQNAFSNLNVISSQAGQPMNLNGSTAVNIPCPLNVVNSVVITNNTVNDCLKINDSNPDNTVFRVDKDGNVGIGVPSASVLTNALTVVGAVSATSITAGNLINNITAGSGLTKTGTSSAPVLSWTGYNLNSTYSGDNIFNGTTKMALSNTNTGYVINYDPSTKLLSYDTTPSSSSVLSTNNSWIGTNSFQNDVSILANGTGFSGSPKLTLTLPDYRTQIAQPDELQYIVQSNFNGKTCYLSRNALNNLYDKWEINVSASNYDFTTSTTAIEQITNCYIYAVNLITDINIKVPNGIQYASADTSPFFDFYFSIQGSNQNGFHINIIYDADVNTSIYLNGVLTASPVALLTGTYYNVNASAFQTIVGPTTTQFLTYWITTK